MLPTYKQTDTAYNRDALPHLKVKKLPPSSPTLPTPLSSFSFQRLQIRRWRPDPKHQFGPVCPASSNWGVQEDAIRRHHNRRIAPRSPSGFKRKLGTRAQRLS